jgi:hypothetical protein
MKNEDILAYRYAGIARSGLFMGARPFIFFGMYLSALCLLDVVFWKALVIAAGVLLLLVNQIAVRLFERFAIVLVISAVLVWIEALPAPSEMRRGARTLWDAGMTSLRH